MQRIMNKMDDYYINSLSEWTHLRILLCKQYTHNIFVILNSFVLCLCEQVLFVYFEWKHIIEKVSNEQKMELKQYCSFIKPLTFP